MACPRELVGHNKLGRGTRMIARDVRTEVYLDTLPLAYPLHQFKQKILAHKAIKMLLCTAAFVMMNLYNMYKWMFKWTFKWMFKTPWSISQLT